MMKPFLLSKNVKLDEVEGSWIQDFKNMDNDTLENLSMVGHIMKGFNEKISRERSDYLESYLKKNLAAQGIEFSNQEEFYSFIKNRVRRVIFEELEEVHYYLDFIDIDNRGEQIGLTHENRVKFEFDPENLKVTATIG